MDRGNSFRTGRSELPARQPGPDRSGAGAAAGSPPFDNSRSDAAEALRFYRSLEREVETLLAGWPAPFREALTGALRVDPKARSSDLADLVRSMAGLRP